MSYMSVLSAKQKKKKRMNHLAYLRRRGLVLSKEEERALWSKYVVGSVLTLRDKELGWIVSNLCWKDRSWFLQSRFVDGLHLYCSKRSGNRWYSRKHKGRSWRSREEAVADLTGKQDTSFSQLVDDSSYSQIVD